MAKCKNSNKPWIFGAVLGAVAGAAFALWKTPMSGQELRGSLKVGPTPSSGDTPAKSGGGLVDKMMTAVEHSLAPIVGVELGKTASGSGEVTEPLTAAEEPHTYEESKKVQPAPVAMAEPEHEYGEQSIRSQRFAWGSPAPEVIDERDEKAKPTEPSVAASAPVAATMPEAAPEPEQVQATKLPESVGEPSPAPVIDAEGTPTSTAYGAESIRAQRFAWGEPAPEAMVATAAATDIPTSESDTGSAPASGTTTPNVAKSVAEPVTAASAAVAPTKMHPFPKLGGLEDNK